MDGGWRRVERRDGNGTYHIVHSSLSTESPWVSDIFQVGDKTKQSVGEYQAVQVLPLDFIAAS